ncbi:MAG: PAS domain-containing sensor histidine kinase, partial [Gammaproteobacteria bacterium]|nr:PAS domain-containing sensor histidine kinase [Gammaproteobacteria bacterium]
LDRYSSPLIDVNGKDQGRAWFFRDITDQKRLAKEKQEMLMRVKDEKLLSDSLVNTTVDGILVVNPEGKAILFNENFVQMFNIPKEILATKDGSKFAGYSLKNLKAPNKFLKEIKELNLHKDRKSRDEVEFKDGKVLDRYSSPLIDVNGKDQGRAWFFRDITDRIRALHAKSEFLANMSHELRTPLNSVIGFSEVLNAETFGPLNEKQKSYMNYVLRSGKHLLLLINDILSLVKVEEGKMELFFSVFPVKKALETSLILLKELLAEKKIESSLEVPEDIGNIEADKRRLKEIIDNLLSNAVKFTPVGGKIGIKAWRRSEEIEFEIWDTGVGIAVENMSKIFAVFTRIEPSFSKATEGTGLGLSYAKKLVELHGGRIWIKSDGLGKGTAVSFTLPIKQKKRK